MTEKPYILLVTIEAKPGKEAALEEILTFLITPTHQEEGCVEYRLHSSPENSGTFMFYEIWANKAAHARHGETAHMAKWKGVKADLVANVTKSDWEEVTP